MLRGTLRAQFASTLPVHNIDSKYLFIAPGIKFRLPFSSTNFFFFYRVILYGSGCWSTKRYNDFILHHFWPPTAKQTLKLGLRASLLIVVFVSCLQNILFLCQTEWHW